MKEKRQVTQKRVIETVIEIDAPPEAVWKALTDAQELMRWFPLKAEVKPGPAGSIWMSWGPPWEGGSRIEIWEPERHLRNRGFIEAEADQAELTATSVVAVDYYIESRGGKTVLRLVHSGFEAGSDWDDELFDGTRRGWQYELRSLRHYLESHHGADRLVAWPRVRVSVPAEEVFRRLLGPEGFLREGKIEGLREGDRYRMRAVTGEVFEGMVVVNELPKDFAGTVRNLNNALLAVRTHEVCGHEPGAGHEGSIWLSTYGVPQVEVEAFRARWQEVLNRLFGS